MAQHDDGQVPSGQGFLRAMAAQSQRARAFDRRMRWSWMRWQLTDHDQQPGPDARTTPDPHVIVLPEAVTPTEAQPVPLQRS